MSGNILEFRDVDISLNGKTLAALNCSVESGEILSIMGPSGSGKSALLSYIAGFMAPAFEARGSVLINGHDIGAVPAEQRKIGLLFQDPLLFPHLSIEGNLRFALRKGQEGKRPLIQNGLKEIGLAGYEDRDPETLSGGQKARVALLRLLLSQPRAVLLDEPFSMLDTEMRQEIRGLVFDRLRASGLPTILVTHDQADADSAGGVIHTLS